MVNSCSIRPEMWDQARRALVFYFVRRHGFSAAEDLAHETLTVIWSRNFEFEKEEQFLRVCYGFASRISQQGHRRAQKLSGDNVRPEVPAQNANWGGLSGAEVGVFLREVCQEAECILTEKDWELVQRLMDDDRAEMMAGLGMKESNRFRVQLFRIRRKLAHIKGFPSRSGRENKV